VFPHRLAGRRRVRVEAVDARGCGLGVDVDDERRARRGARRRAGQIGDDVGDGDRPRAVDAHPPLPPTRGALVDDQRPRVAGVVEADADLGRREPAREVGVARAVGDHRVELVDRRRRREHDLQRPILRQRLAQHVGRDRFRPLDRHRAEVTELSQAPGARRIAGADRARARARARAARDRRRGQEEQEDEKQRASVERT
jgi:hypothetical protein